MKAYQASLQNTLAVLKEENARLKSVKFTDIAYAVILNHQYIARSSGDSDGAANVGHITVGSKKRSPLSSFLCKSCLEELTNRRPNSSG